MTLLDRVRRMVRKGDPETSVEAAAIAAQHISRTKQHVLAYAVSRHPHPFTDYELETFYQSYSSSLRTRRRELADAGRLVRRGTSERPGDYRKRVLWGLPE